MKMPNIRTPPASPLPMPIDGKRSNETPTLLTAGECQLSQCSSAPDLSIITSKLNERKKRKLDGDDNNKGTVTMSVFTAFLKQQEGRFEDLIYKINNILEQNLELKKSVEVMSSKYDEFLSRISNLESERKEDKKTIHQLEEKVEYLERKSRATGLEIRNVPKIHDETKDQLCDMVVSMGKTLAINIGPSDIRDIYRTKSKDSSNPIIIDLNTVIMKDKIIKGVKKFNKSKDKKEKLHTTHFGLQSPPQPVYVSETLTYKAQRIYFLARQFQKGNGYDFCWTSHGIVYLRKSVEFAQIRINSESDLEKLRSAP